jgi:hypothetical protein
MNLGTDILTEHVMELITSGGWVSLAYKGTESTIRKHTFVRVAIGRERVFKAVVHLRDEISWEVPGKLLSDAANVYMYESGGEPVLVIPFLVKETINGKFTIVPQKEEDDDYRNFSFT